MDIHWYCPCGSTRQSMSAEIADRTSPMIVCGLCRELVGPVAQSVEVSRRCGEEGC